MSEHDPESWLWSNPAAPAVPTLLSQTERCAPTGQPRGDGAQRMIRTPDQEPGQKSTHGGVSPRAERASTAGVAMVIGAAGGFGRIFVELLAAGGRRVVAVDQSPELGSAFPAHQTNCETFGARSHQMFHTDCPPDQSLGQIDSLLADATAPSKKLLDALARTDLLLLCIPERALFPALQPLLRAIPAGALVIDVTSVKSKYSACALAIRDDLEFCSLEPLFAPDVGFAGQPVLVAELRPGPRTVGFLELLGHTGARLTKTTADAIDRQAAATQVAAHAALIAYGAAIGTLDFDPDGPDTALQRALAMLTARVANRDPDVYWHIQRDNPYADAAREALQSALARLTITVTTDDREGFLDSHAAAGAAFGTRLSELAGRSAAVVTAASRAGGPNTAD